MVFVCELEPRDFNSVLLYDIFPIRIDYNSSRTVAASHTAHAILYRPHGDSGYGANWMAIEMKHVTQNEYNVLILNKNNNEILTDGQYDSIGLACR